MFGSFFRRVSRDLYDVPAGEELWHLFLVITLNKSLCRGRVLIARQARRAPDDRRPGHRSVPDGPKSDQHAYVLLKLAVEEALDRLPAQHRLAVQLRMEGHEVVEIARMMGRGNDRGARISRNVGRNWVAYSWIHDMVRLGCDPNRDELDEFVRAFEQAYSRNGHAEIAEFLPPCDHDLHATVLCELIRLDLEFGWERGCPKTLSEYQRVFPELEHDRDGLRAIAFEEDRLRRRAEEESPCAGAVLPTRRGDAGEAIGWLPQGGGSTKTPRDISATARAARPEGSIHRQRRWPSRHDGVERAALAYRDFRRHHDEGDIAALESWCASFPAAGPARLFRDVHLSDPRGADRFARGLSTLPEVGDNFLGFHLIGELGQGAFGKVYLAQQGDLADRPVALKVSPDFFGESQTLAQLQHTNIVPIYSIHRLEPLAGGMHALFRIDHAEGCVSRS